MTRLIKLKTFREECGGCPTHYTGETVSGAYFDAYLRHGYMKITLEEEIIVSTNPNGLDGVCSFDDFRKEALKKGYLLDNSEAVSSSYIDEIEKTVRELYLNKVWIEFLRDLPSESAGKTYQKGERYMMDIENAKKLEKIGFVAIEKSVISK